MLEWTDPPFSAGHWVPDMVATAGATCVLGDAGERSRPLDWDELTESAPEVIVVAPCGYGLPGATDLAVTLQRTGRLPADADLWAVDADAADRSLASSMAKAYVSDAYRKVAGDGIQVHGGIGFTWEHDMHLYFKRAKSSEVTLGDATYHRELVAQALDL